MHDNKTDIFEHSGKKSSIPNNNFFISNEAQAPVNKLTEPSRRLNDYDFNLLKESAYKDIGDDLLKLEYRISKSEEEIKNLDMQLKAAEEIRDFRLIESLSKRIETEKNNCKSLVEIYNKKSLSAKISGSVSNIIEKPFKKGFETFNEVLLRVKLLLISILPKKFASFMEVKMAMHKLENINKSVDKLIAMNIPYGENADKYRQLSEYIIKANSIQSEISDYIKKR